MPEREHAFVIRMRPPDGILRRRGLAFNFHRLTEANLGNRSAAFVADLDEMAEAEMALKHFGASHLASSPQRTLARRGRA